MNTCALSQGQTAPCASKGSSGFPAGVVVANPGYDEMLCSQGLQPSGRSYVLDVSKYCNQQLWSPRCGGSRTRNLVHQSASWLFNITIQSFFSLNVTANKFSGVHCCIRWLLLCSHFHLFDAEEQKCRAEKQMMNLRSPQRCFHSAAASPGHPSNLCRNKLLLRISPSSDWLPWSPCLHPLFPFHPKAPWFVPTLPLPPLVSSTSLGRSTPPHPFLRPSLPLPLPTHPPTLSAAGWKTQSFIHLFPPPFLCSLFILVSITLPVGTLRGS